MDSQLIKILADTPELYPHMLERTYPHIIAKIASAWPSARQAQTLFNQLLIDDRGNRQGFPPEVGREIMRLAIFYADLQPKLD